MAADMIQRSAIQSALALHLEICTQHCSSHDLFKYLIDQGHSLEPFFGEISNKIVSVKNKGKKDKKVKFADTVQCDDGSINKLHSYKVALENSKQVLFYYCHYIECSLKELLFVQISDC